MVGSNCSIAGCHASRRHLGVAIFKVPKPSNEFNIQWTNNIVQIIVRDRKIDALLQKQIDDYNVHVCERHLYRHYREDQLIS